MLLFQGRRIVDLVCMNLIYYRFIRRFQSFIQVLLDHIILVTHNYLFERYGLNRSFRNSFINTRVILSASISVMRHDVHFVFQDVLEFFYCSLLNLHRVFQVLAVLLGQVLHQIVQIIRPWRSRILSIILLRTPCRLFRRRICHR